MTKPYDFAREEFTTAQLKKLTDKASWDSLVDIAIEMDFDIKKLSVLKYNPAELRKLMIAAWREKSAVLKLCQTAYKKLRKERERDAQNVMSFLNKEAAK